MLAPSPGNEENRALPFFLFLSLNRFPVIIDISVFADDPNSLRLQNTIYPIIVTGKLKPTIPANHVV